MRERRTGVGGAAAHLPDRLPHRGLLADQDTGKFTGLVHICYGKDLLTGKKWQPGELVEEFHFGIIETRKHEGPLSRTAALCFDIREGGSGHLNGERITPELTARSRAPQMRWKSPQKAAN
ncbi:hypothetical protein BJA01nite_50440 [Bradyrhizobium japonicum]|jgi:hypothetical protein|nr:hypothetical protein BJA01nite_50440 [Bradyrhizobium japonicum]